MKQITFTEDELNNLIEVIETLKDAYDCNNKHMTKWSIDVLNDWAKDWPNYLKGE